MYPPVDTSIADGTMHLVHNQLLTSSDLCRVSIKAQLTNFCRIGVCSRNMRFETNGH